MSDLRAIGGFRLVSQNSHRLARFYQAIGFAIGTEQPIDHAEMALLGLVGAGTRLPLTLGASRVELDCYEQSGQAYPTGTTAANSVFQHLAIVTTDIADAWARAMAAGATAISHDGPVVLPASSGGVVAVKFRDPEGHPLEFLQFPAGTNAAWPRTGILGIDHSAVSAASADRSIAFYAAHGLTQGDRTLNEGPTQVALDGIDAVVVDVVPLLPARAPAHLELLCYHGPHVPRDPPMPNDIAATRIVWHADRDALVRDPDGHLHQLVIAK
jgi:catechol 2,3-dioxygenase-like lactoylglutathione lyase family enzyme